MSKKQQAVATEAAGFSKVAEGVYMGNRSCAKNKDLLLSLGIRSIVNCTMPKDQGGVHNFFSNVEPFQYLRVPVIDSDKADIFPHFHRSVKFIEDGLKDHYSVLVHCQQGVSRSAAVVLAYLMKSKKWSLVDAYTHLKKVRPMVKPKPNFLKQLINYETKLKEIAKKHKERKQTEESEEKESSPKKRPLDESCSSSDNGENNTTSTKRTKTEPSKKRVYGVAMPPNFAQSQEAQEAQEAQASNTPQQNSEQESNEKSKKQRCEENTDNHSDSQSSSNTEKDSSRVKKKVYGVALPPNS